MIAVRAGESSRARSGWSKVVVADNLFGNAAENDARTVALRPQNDESAEGNEDIVTENNRFVHNTATQTDLILAGRRMTYRGNVRTSGGPITEGTGHDGALPQAWKGPYYGP